MLRDNMTLLSLRAPASPRRWAAMALFVVFLVCACPLANLFAEEKFDYNPKGKRNPFIPLVTPDGRILKLDTVEARTEDISLEGIMYDKLGAFFAIVNSVVVKTGDSVEGYQVLKIEKDKVVLIKDNQVREVGLSKGGI